MHHYHHIFFYMSAGDSHFTVILLSQHALKLNIKYGWIKRTSLWAHNVFCPRTEVTSRIIYDEFQRLAQ